MFGADLTVTAGNDGVKSTEDSDAAKGFLQLTDGSAAVTAGGDCLQAESLVWVTDGTYTLTSNGTAVDAETGETSSSKGIKCSGDVEIAGGTLTIDAAEDGVNCGGAMEIQDGEMTVSSAEDGIQADGDLHFRRHCPGDDHRRSGSLCTGRLPARQFWRRYTAFR